jgi:hypothetical protein
VGLATVQLWLARAGELALDEVDWADRPPLARHVARTGEAIEERVLAIRRELREESILGEYGPEAVRRELLARGIRSDRVPSARTIARIAERRGALDATRRIRRPAPPPGWYLPDVAQRAAELDSFDVIEGLRLLGGTHVDVFTAISLHGGLADAWPETGMSAARMVRALASRWSAVGVPGYAQFDNDARFTGGLRWPDSVGGVIRFCLGVQVVPVFAPPRETGFQAAIEAFNGRWQQKLWARVWDPTLAALQERSAEYIQATHRRSAERIDAAPARRRGPLDAVAALRGPLAGRLVFLRRTSDRGTVRVLGRSYPVDPYWQSRLVRSEVDLDAHRLAVYALRRRSPTDQPLLVELDYVPPDKWRR